MQENGALDSKKNKADCYNNRFHATAAKISLNEEGMFCICGMDKLKLFNWLESRYGPT